MLSDSRFWWLIEGGWFGISYCQRSICPCQTFEYLYLWTRRDSFEQFHALMHVVMQIPGCLCTWLYELYISVSQIKNSPSPTAKLDALSMDIHGLMIIRSAKMFFSMPRCWLLAFSQIDSEGNFSDGTLHRPGDLYFQRAVVHRQCYWTALVFPLN